MHDLGKVLCLYGEPQWAVVGDTFPTGCPYSPKVVYSEFFAANPDMKRPEFQNGTGIYKEGCGLSDVHMSWGHDEYLYHLTRNYLPEPAQYMIRFHSFYAWHKHGAYQHPVGVFSHASAEHVRSDADARAGPSAVRGIRPRRRRPIC